MASDGGGTSSTLVEAVGGHLIGSTGGGSGGHLVGTAGKDSGGGHLVGTTGGDSGGGSSSALEEVSIATPATSVGNSVTNTTY